MISFMRQDGMLDALTTSQIRFIGKSISLIPGTFRLKLSDFNNGVESLVVMEDGSLTLRPDLQYEEFYMWIGKNMKSFDMEFELPMDCSASYLAITGSSMEYVFDRSAEAQKAHVDFKYNENSHRWGLQMDLFGHNNASTTSRNFKILSMSATLW